MTPGQLATYNATITGAGGCASPFVGPILQAAVATGASSNVAVKGDLNVNVDGSQIPMTTLLYGPTIAGQLPNSKFFPGSVNCPPNTVVNNDIFCNSSGVGLVPLPASYVG